MSTQKLNNEQEDLIYLNCLSHEDVGEIAIPLSYPLKSNDYVDYKSIL